MARKALRKALMMIFGGAGVASLMHGFFLSLSNEGARISRTGCLDSVWPWFVAIPVFLFWRFYLSRPANPF